MRRHDVATPVRALQRVVGVAARRERLGARRIEAIDHALRRVLDHQRHLAVPQRVLRLVRRHHLRNERARLAQRRELALVQHRDRHAVGRLVAEGESERQRQDDRKPEHPEHRLRLADELLGADGGELEEGRTDAGHRAAPGRHGEPLQVQASDPKGV